MKKVLWMMLALTLCLVVLVGCGDEPPAPDVCTVTFDAGDGEFDDGKATATKETVEGDLVDEPDEPTLLGYTFLGWAESENSTSSRYWDFDEDIVDEDMTLYARWEPTEYNITYNGMNGASIPNNGRNPSKYTVAIEDAITLKAPEKTGFLFDGWFNQMGDRISEIAPGTTGNIVLEARWTPESYPIDYAGVEQATQNNNPASYTIETTYTLVDPVRPGFRFEGWYTITGVKVTSIQPGRTGALVLEARWTELSFTATYQGLMGATHTNPERFSSQDTITLTDPVLEGETFLGWYLDGTKVTQIKKQSRNIVLVARWQGYNAITYAGVGGATHTNPETYREGYGVATLTDAVKEGYTFLGWFDANDQRVTEVGTDVTGDIVLTAKWEMTAYGITYNGTDGATHSNPATYTVQNQVILKDAVKEHYTFLGWYDGQNQRVTVIELGSTGAVTLTARWEPKTYQITYGGVDGATHSNPATYTVESQITLAAPTKSGLTFSHWEDEDGNTVTEIALGTGGNLTLIARWEGVYRITYEGVEGGTNTNPAEGVGGTAVTLTAPTMDGATFLGWFNESGEQVTSISVDNTADLTLRARWIPHLSYTDDGNGGLIVSGIGDYPGIYLDIPATYNEKAVTGIAQDAFYGNTTLVSITIPDSVVTIGQSAFHNLTALKELVIGAGVTEMAPYAFRGCVSLETVKIESGVTVIGAFAFYGCYELTSIEIPATVVTVGEAAFYGCESLAEIDLSEVTTLGEQVFYGCTGLTTVDISKTTTIGAFLFYGCSSLESIAIPETVDAIGNYAFRGCASLTEVTIPNTVLTIGEGAFQLCADLATVNLGTGVTKIRRFAFADCESLTAVNVTTTGWSYYTVEGGTATAADLSVAATAAQTIAQNSSKLFQRS